MSPLQTGVGCWRRVLVPGGLSNCRRRVHPTPGSTRRQPDARKTLMFPEGWRPRRRVDSTFIKSYVQEREMKCNSYKQYRNNPTPDAVTLGAS